MHYECNTLHFIQKVSKGQGKVWEISDQAKFREKGNFSLRSGKIEFWEKSGNFFRGVHKL